MATHNSDYYRTQQLMVSKLLLIIKVRNDTSLKVYIDQIDENKAKTLELLGKQQRKL